MKTPFRSFRIEVEARMQEVEAVCLKIRNLMRIEPDLGPRETFAVELLAREALSNAVRHGCREDARLKVRCRFRLGRLRAILEVEDDGPGFPWQASLDQSGDTAANEAPHGRGLSIYLIYASGFFFNTRGNRILLIRSFPESPMSDNNPHLDGNRALLHPGEMTATRVEEVRGQIKDLLQAGARELTMDLAGVQMVDSIGIGLLIQANNSLKKLGGSLTVCHLSPELKELFLSMRLDKWFTLQD